MNRFGIDTVVNIKMGKILLESTALTDKEYKWIKDILKDKDEPVLKYSELEELEKAKKEFFTSSLFKKFYKTVCKEWEMVDLIDDNKPLECSLCGQKDTKKKYYIKNKLNGTILNVGSTCINNFDDISGIDGKSRQEIEKEWKIRNRDKYLNEKYPGIISKIDNWSKNINQIPTIIKGNFEKEYFSILQEISELHEKFRKKITIDDSIAKKINDLVNNGEHVLERIHKDVESKKDNEWFISKEIKEWVYKNNDNKILETFLKEDGLITWRSAYRIYESNLVEKIINKLKTIFNNSTISIKKFDNQTNSIIININGRNIYTNHINLSCPYSKFLSEFGNTIFESDTTFDNEKNFVIENSQIIDDASLNMSISNLKYTFKKYGLNINSWNIDYNEIVFVDYISKSIISYKVLDLKKFINNFLSFVFKSSLTENDIQNIKHYIKHNSSSRTPKEYAEILERRKQQEKATQIDYSRFM